MITPASAPRTPRSPKSSSTTSWTSLPAGTTAAAATGVAVGTAEPAAPLTLTFTRPFLLLLEDAATHTPLFLAQVTDPAQN